MKRYGTQALYDIDAYELQVIEDLRSVIQYEPSIVPALADTVRVMRANADRSDVPAEEMEPVTIAMISNYDNWRQASHWAAITWLDFVRCFALLLNPEGCGNPACQAPHYSWEVRQTVNGAPVVFDPQRIHNTDTIGQWGLHKIVYATLAIAYRYCVENDIDVSADPDLPIGEEWIEYKSKEDRGDDFLTILSQMAARAGGAVVVAGSAIAQAPTPKDEPLNVPDDLSGLDPEVYPSIDEYEGESRRSIPAEDIDNEYKENN